MKTMQSISRAGGGYRATGNLPELESGLVGMDGRLKWAERVAEAQCRQSF